MMRLRRASVIVSLIAMLSQVTSVATAFTEDGWVLWRHYVSLYSPQIDDSQMWRAQPGTKTRKQCESEVKEYQKFDPGRGTGSSTAATPTPWTQEGRKGSKPALQDITNAKSDSVPVYSAARWGSGLL
jgi:hypothetical protein